MKTLSTELKAFLDENKLWMLATASTANIPNVVPIYFAKVLDDHKLMLVDVFMQKSLANIKQNGKVAISACNAEKLQGYQLKGTATYVTAGPLMTIGNEMAAALKLSAKGIVTIEVEEIIVTSPGPEIGKKL